jgi:hypothetical protein
MNRSLLLLLASLTGVTPVPAAEVLIVADEFPAMHFLADKLKSEAESALEAADPDKIMG